MIRELFLLQSNTRKMHKYLYRLFFLHDNAKVLMDCRQLRQHFDYKIQQNQQSTFTKPFMTQIPPVQPHEQDDCEGCQKERAENNQLIDFYQRLHKIKTKVSQIKPTLAQHGAVYREEQGRLEKMGVKMGHGPNLTAEMKDIDEKEMGYQLTCALLEREIKMKRENEELSRRIRQMKLASEAIHSYGNEQKKSMVIKRDSEMQSDPQTELHYSKLYHASNNGNGIQSDTSKQFKVRQSRSVFSDSLDDAVQGGSFWGTHQVSPIRSERAKEDNSRYSIPFAYRDNNKDASTFSSFEETGRTVFNNSAVAPEEAKKKFDNLNLWLYQYNVQEEPVTSKINTKSKLRKPR